MSNFTQIRKRIDRYEKLISDRDRGELAKYTKRERMLIDKEIAKYKLPERMELMSDFPLSTFGKVSKKDLVATVSAKMAAALP